MNAQARGGVLAVIAVVLGVVVLGQGFGTQEATLVSSVDAVSATGDDGSSDAGAGDDSGAADGTTDADDGTGTIDDDGGDDNGAVADESDGDDGGTADEDAGGVDTGPDILHPQAEVRVLVANGAGVAGLAGRTRDQLVSAQNYNGLTPTNTKVPASESVVYYIAGYELDARNIAKILNASPEAVAPMPAVAELPIADLAEAHVLVVIAADLASES